MEMDWGIKIYLREIWKTPLLTIEEENELAGRIKLWDKEARAHMIKANLRLVVKMAQDYANYWLPLLDLISEGNIGLMKAVERFDPNKGGKLSTYAAYWIKQGIKRALANQSKTIRLPIHMIDKISNMRKVAMALSEQLGREPTDDELAAEIGIDRAKLSHIKSAALRPASLDAPLSDDDNTELGEIIGDGSAWNPSELASHKNMHMQLDELMKVLDERELIIITMRFGLDGKKAKTLEEVSEEFVITRERIRQLQNIALKKLRKALAKMDEKNPLEEENGELDKKTPPNNLLTEAFKAKIRQQVQALSPSKKPIKPSKSKKPRLPKGESQKKEAVENRDSTDPEQARLKKILLSTSTEKGVRIRKTDTRDAVWELYLKRALRKKYEIPEIVPLVWMSDVEVEKCLKN